MKSLKQSGHNSTMSASECENNNDDINNTNNESTALVDHSLPSPPSLPVQLSFVNDAHGVVVAVDDSSQSTASWDFADSIGSTCTPTENDVPAINNRTRTSVLLRVTELEEQIALLKAQTDSLRVENAEKSKVIHDQQKVIEELETLRDESDEMSETIVMKDTILFKQEAKIHELTEKLQAKEGIGEAVTVKFYEAEEEISKLRNDKYLASLVVKVLLDMNHELLDNPEKLPIASFHSDPSEWFHALIKGSEVLEMDLLLHFAKACASRALEIDRKWAVTFLLTSLENERVLGSNDMVTTMCLDIIRSDLGLLLESDKVNLLSAECIKMLMKDPNIQTDELTLFRVLLQWTLGSEQDRKEVSKDLVQYIALEHIDPLELSTTVRSSGLVSDSMLCDAYGKQAANKDLAKGRMRAEPEYTCAKWDGLESDVFVGKNPNIWATGIITARVMKDVGVLTWDMTLEESGEVIFGVSNASHDFQQQNPNQFGAFMPKRVFAKGSFVRCQLCISHGGSKSFSLSIDGAEFASTLQVVIDGGLLVTACVRGGAAVKFIGFKNA
jgi:hypothetical protein